MCVSLCLRFYGCTSDTRPTDKAPFMVSFRRRQSLSGRHWSWRREWRHRKTQERHYLVSVLLRRHTSPEDGSWLHCWEKKQTCTMGDLALTQMAGDKVRHWESFQQSWWSCWFLSPGAVLAWRPVVVETAYFLSGSRWAARFSPLCTFS